MANRAHLIKIEQGGRWFNEWRQENPELIPDLRSAYLIGKDLRYTDLHGADLSDAKLFKVEFIGANLNSANLSGAYLRDSSLGGADLTGANLIGANLENVNLLRACLNGAKLSGATLTEARLSGARLFEASLDGANLNGADLSVAHLNGAHLRRAHLVQTNLSQARLTGADLSGADLSRADLREAHLDKAILSKANLRGTDLTRANFSGADLREADLSRSRLIETDLRHAPLTGSKVYGASVWDIKVNKLTKQENLVITDYGDVAITVDNIKVAQFIYLLLNNQEIREVIHTIGNKAVLILGRFSKERKVVLDAIREELRHHNYLPIMFDFEATTNQRIDETVKTLAGMSRFVIADITDARSVPQQLQIIDTHCRTVAVRLIKKRGEPEYGMLDFRNSPWFVKGICQYDSSEELIASIEKNVIVPAEAKVRKLRKK